MAAKLIDGIALSKSVRDSWRERAHSLGVRGVRPTLAVILVGDNPASRVYVRNKTGAAAELGMTSRLMELPQSTPQGALLERIDALNHDPAIHGILVQLPLPQQIQARSIIEAIAPEKDVDAFHPENVGLLTIGHPRFVPCTPAGVMAMLEAESIDPWAKRAVIVGASNIVGKPMAMLLLQKGATVTLCNSKTRDLGVHTREAEILVAAVGKANIIRGDMVKHGAAVIDVGINRLPDGKLCGDVEFASARDVAGWITPVPGGVGPMTVTMLLVNTIRAAEFAATRAVNTEQV
jgi:methylenetetrahydrofolate dehydrogenase (NADP+) / methenyltetrahydrofolate cyclohydrolase